VPDRTAGLAAAAQHTLAFLNTLDERPVADRRDAECAVMSAASVQHLSRGDARQRRAAGVAGAVGVPGASAGVLAAVAGATADGLGADGRESFWW
jgi:hypothetical protein